jgi:hypothetical protein
MVDVQAILKKDKITLAEFKIILNIAFGDLQHAARHREIDIIQCVTDHYETELMTLINKVAFSNDVLNQHLIDLGFTGDVERMQIIDAVSASQLVSQEPTKEVIK